MISRRDRLCVWRISVARLATWAKKQRQINLSRGLLFFCTAPRTLLPVLFRQQRVPYALRGAQPRTACAPFASFGIFLHACAAAPLPRASTSRDIQQRGANALAWFMLRRADIAIGMSSTDVGSYSIVQSDNAVAWACVINAAGYRSLVVSLFDQIWLVTF